MKKNLQFLLLAGFLGLSASIASAAHIKLFVLTGQSNSLGTTNGGEADPSSGSDPADQHVQFFWHNVVNATTTIGTSGGVFTTLQDQQGGYYGGSATHWSGEMEFARTLYRAGVRDFGIIKASRGGGGNSFWLKGSTDDHMYVHVSNTVHAATADLTANGHTYEIVGLLYLQGESDNSTEAAAAGTRLKLLTDNLRTDLPNASAMHTVAAGITYAGSATDDTTRANQEAIAASTSYIGYFDNTDLQDRLAPDGIHLNKAAKIVVGNRWAQAFLNAGIVDRHYGNLVFIGDSITQGGNGRPSYRYQVFKNLANADVPINPATGYKFVGSLNGAYQNSDVSGATPDVNGQSFENNHDGHWGWRAMWENGRVVLPVSRRSSNRGEGTILNWTGQASPQQYITDGGTKDFPDLTASGTGVANPYTPYTPDTASIMIGINETGASSASQIRDDLGTMIDQLRGANPNVRIHLNELLYSDNVADATVDAVNTLLPQLVSEKNAASSSSPVWLVTANSGFVPSTHTYDNTHPNTAGETQVGDIISGSLGIIETTEPTPVTAPVVIEEKASADLGCLKFEGSDIFNAGSYVSGWSASGGITPAEVGGSDLRLIHPGTSGDTLDGTGTGWSDINDGLWTVTTRLKFDANPNGVILWLGTGTHRILIEIHGDRTQDVGADSFSVTNNNVDGLYHTFKVTHDPSAAVYHVWRDGVLLTAPAGATYDQSGADERLLLGDYTSGVFGDGFDLTIDYIKFCGGYEGNEIYAGQAAASTVVWRRDWEQLASNTTINNSNLDGGPVGAVDIGSQDFTVVSGPVRTWDGVVGGRDLISTSSTGLFESTVEITDVQYAADIPLTLDFVIGTGSSNARSGEWFVEFGTIAAGVFSVLSSVDSGSASYNSGAITLNEDENFMDNANSSPLFGYNVGGRLQQLVVDATDAVNGQNVAIRFGISSSAQFAGFTDMALSVPGSSTTYSYVNGWTTVGGISQSLTNNTDLQVANTTGGGSWLEGTGSGWSDANEGYWTWETRMKFDANPEGFLIWLGTGNDLVQVAVYADRTEDYENDVFSKSHNNLDGEFHTFRIGHDSSNFVYHVWRDDERLTPIDGAGYDSSLNDERLIMGDSTGGSFGNGFDVTIDYVHWDTGNAYLPPGADADSDGMSDLYEDTYFGGITNGIPTANSDSDGTTDLDEYIADTNPTDGGSFFHVSAFTEATADAWNITVPGTSAAREYTLQASGDLGMSDPWTDVPGQGPLPGNGSDLVFSETISVSTSRFFRVKVAIP